MDFHDFFGLHVDQEDPIRRKSEAVLEELPSRRRKGRIWSLNAGLHLRHEALPVTLDEEIRAQLHRFLFTIHLDPPNTANLVVPSP